VIRELILEMCRTLREVRRSLKEKRKASRRLRKSGGATTKVEAVSATDEQMATALKEAEWTAKQYSDLVRDYSAKEACVPIPEKGPSRPTPSEVTIPATSPETPPTEQSSPTV
jgi:hypothetical protein